jgi:3-hydroxy acid dehydrogenase/malonic semialdehyde reductase
MFVRPGSIAGRKPYMGGSIYCVTKHAVRAFTSALLQELVETQMRVTEI